MATGEIHIELAVNFAEDPKLRSLLRHGPDVRGLRDLYVLMICYCKRNLTDGFVPLEEVGLMVYPDLWENGQRDAKRLIEAGLIQETDGGYVVAAYVKRNRTKAEVLQLAQDKASGGTLGNHKRWHEAKGIVRDDCPHCRSAMACTADSHTDRTTDRTTDRGSESPTESPRPADLAASASSALNGSRTEGPQSAVHATLDEKLDLGQPSDLGQLDLVGTDRSTDRSPSRVRSPKTETETETEEQKNPPTPQGGKRRKRRVGAEDYDSDPDFVRFWNVFPVKGGKVDAFKAWQSAVGRGDNPELMIQAAEWFRDDPTRDPEHTKWAQGWLNGRRYKEQKPTRPRRGGGGNFWEN
jgi:hypothetical protein